MDVNVRNNLYFDYTDMIRRIMRRNRLLLYALRLEREDVFQKLSIVALMAIESFEPSRSDCLAAHVWMKLQYAVLTMKQRQSPGGLTGLKGARPVIYSVEYCEELRHPLTTPIYIDTTSESDIRLRKALSRLDPDERNIVLLYLDGYKPQRKKDKSTFISAIEKLKSYYTAEQMVLA